MSDRQIAAQGDFGMGGLTNLGGSTNGNPDLSWAHTGGGLYRGKSSHPQRARIPLIKYPQLFGIWGLLAWGGGHEHSAARLLGY